MQLIFLNVMQHGGPVTDRHGKCREQEGGCEFVETVRHQCILTRGDESNVERDIGYGRKDQKQVEDKLFLESVVAPGLRQLPFLIPANRPPNCLQDGSKHISKYRE